MTEKANTMFANTTRNLDELRELLDGPITITLPDKPLTPSQKDRKIRSAFNCILSHLAILRTELETDARRAAERLEYVATHQDTLKDGLFGNKLVISPKPILSARRALVDDKRLKTVQDMFSELLGVYETHFRQKWKPEKGAK